VSGVHTPSKLTPSVSRYVKSSAQIGMRSSLKSGSTNSRKSFGFTMSVTNVLMASPQTICWRPSLTSRSPWPMLSNASRSESSVFWSRSTLAG